MHGAVMVDLERAVDRTERLFAQIDAVPAWLLADVRDRIATLLEIQP